jgi:Carboxypeptidase regulatory-like domain/TonB dependent receptor
VRKFTTLLCCATAFVCLSAGNLFAQLNSSATLRGTVADKTQAVIPNADVTVTNKETGLTRTATTGNEGSYLFNLLPSGHYQVKVAVKGFATAAFENVELAVGQTTTIDAILAPSQQAETVTVEASGASLVDVQKTDVSRIVSPNEVVNLPTNGRDFVSLAVLAPGARPVNSYDPTKNRIGVFATNGSNGRNVNVTVNGVDNKDGTVGGPVMQLPLEAIEEFNISTQRFSAANGRSEGAAVNVITKSGTNAFHGSLYFFDREDAFNTLNYFEKKENGGSGEKSPFSRQQFGGSIGGPVKKDKTFLFFALERSREQTSINVTPQAFSELTLLKANGFAADPSTTIPTPYFDWRYNGRLDHRINDKNNFALSYSNQNNRGLNDQATQTSDLTAGNFTTNQLIIANATLNSVISPRIVNAATVGYQYWNNLIDSVAKVPTFSFGNPANPDATFGTNVNVPQESFQRKWQFRDDLSINMGKHSFKTGFDYLWEPTLGGFFIANPTINFNFFDDPSVILSNKQKYPQGFATPGAVQQITDTSGNPYFRLNPKMFGVYFQDDWKVKRNLSLSLGLRWDRDFDTFGGPEQANARTYQYLKAINSPYAGLPQDDKKNFSPRFGLAYDLHGNGKHVIRAGYGLYFGQSFQNINLFMLQQTNSLLFTTVQLNTADIVPSTGRPLSEFRYGVDPNPAKPAASTQLARGATGQLMDPNYRNPYTQQWNGGYTWAVTNSSAIEVEYVHVLGLHDSKRIVINPKINGVRNTDAPLAAAGLPVIGAIRDNQSIGRSRYDAMNLSYRKRMSQHFSLNTSYVLSRSLGYNGASASFANAPTDLRDIFAAHDFGPTPADERHRWVVSGLVELPWGIKFAPIMQLASARPYQALQGVNDTYGFGGSQGNTHAIVLDSDPNNLLATKNYTTAQLQACLTANTCHQVGYDNMRGATFFQLDTRVSKQLKFGERAKLDLIFQAFDLTNRANFGATFQGNIKSPVFGQPNGFITPAGVIVPRSFSGEFGARFSF